MIPIMPPRQYLTLSLRGMGFNVLETNLLSIPSQVLATASMMTVLWFAERTGHLLAWTSLYQIWALPFLIWLRVAFEQSTSKWTTWSVLTLMIAAPMRELPL
jgi:hypothetical protein